MGSLRRELSDDALLDVLGADPVRLPHAQEHVTVRRELGPAVDAEAPARHEVDDEGPHIEGRPALARIGEGLTERVAGCGGRGDVEGVRVEEAQHPRVARQQGRPHASTRVRRTEDRGWLGGEEGPCLRWDERSNEAPKACGRATCAHSCLHGQLAQVVRRRHCESQWCAGRRADVMRAGRS
jgi:hypothetical protein